MNMGKLSANMKIWLSLPVVAVLLAGCEDGIRPYSGANSIIAAPIDRGLGDNVLTDGAAAIVYDPDGCQGWLIDDGIEGYSGRRFDPVSGLPVCNNLYPPGTVIGNYQNDPKRILPDFVKGRY
jgi:hypothetical protein